MAEKKSMVCSYFVQRPILSMDITTTVLDRCVVHIKPASHALHVTYILSFSM